MKKFIQIMFVCAVTLVTGLGFVQTLQAQTEPEWCFLVCEIAGCDVNKSCYCEWGLTNCGSWCTFGC